MTQPTFALDVAIASFNDLINSASTPEEKARLMKQKQEVLAQQDALERQDLEELPSKKKKV